MVVTVVILVAYRNYKYEQELDSLLWKIDSKDLRVSIERKKVPSHNGWRIYHPFYRRPILLVLQIDEFTPTFNQNGKSTLALHRTSKGNSQVGTKGIAKKFVPFYPNFLSPFLLDKFRPPWDRRRTRITGSP